MTLTFLALLACKGGDADDTAAVDSEPQAEGVDAIAARYLSGRFDSSAQEARDPRYYNISLVTCPISMPELGEHVLYVEQALADTPSDPYRQRVYTVSALEDGRALTAIYAFINPDAVVGLCDAAGELPFTADDLTERTGCGVYLSWDGAAFEGSTEGEGCGTTLGGTTPPAR